MTGKLLESGAISAFCSSVATMLAAGVQTDEAVHMLAENRAAIRIQAAHADGGLLQSRRRLQPRRRHGGYRRRRRPYATETVRIGEASGRTERVLRSLGRYDDSEGRAFAKLRNSVGYPAALLCIMQRHPGVHRGNHPPHLLQRL